MLCVHGIALRKKNHNSLEKVLKLLLEFATD
jgi:hypothetical protein